MLNNSVWCFHFCLRACYMYACHLNILVIWWEMCNFINLPCNWSHANYIIFLGFSHTTAHLCKVVSWISVFIAFLSLPFVMILILIKSMTYSTTMLMIVAESIHEYVLFMIWISDQYKNENKVDTWGKEITFSRNTFNKKLKEQF